MDNLEQLTEILKYSFNEISLLDSALTHKSYSFEFNNGVGDNERLEFLGDSIIGLCVSEILFHKYPDYPEGKLTLMKSYLVSKKFLAELAVQLDIGKFIKLGTGEEKTGGRKRMTILGNTFEAIAGAIFVDGGYCCASEFINRFIEPKLEIMEISALIYNYKNLLQIYFQKEYGKLPHYKIHEESGPQHEKIYTIAVTIDDRILGIGSDSSKKKAGQKAAQNALSKLNLI